MWSPHNAFARWESVENAELQMPIFFEGQDGRLGISLEATIDGRCHDLRDAEQFAPLGNRPTTYIRILVSIISRGVISVAC